MTKYFKVFSTDDKINKPKPKVRFNSELKKSKTGKWYLENKATEK